jgi:hypothetical protein
MFEKTDKKASIVISQSMYFPWAGMLEQIKLCNKFIHYDDVQFSKGSFSNRVQVKTQSGVCWLTVPLKRQVLGQLINEVEIDYANDWQKNHISTLKHAYSKSSNRAEMLALVESVFSHQYSTLAELSKASMMSLIKYFELDKNREFLDSSDLNVSGSSSQRVIDICLRVKGKKYLTGHGAKNYLDHETFEKVGLEVDYINYSLSPYQQLHGAFTPYVSALDLVANCGRSGIKKINGNLVPWREFIAISD